MDGLGAFPAESAGTASPEAGNAPQSAPSKERRKLGHKLIFAGMLVTLVALGYVSTKNTIAGLTASSRFREKTDNRLVSLEGRQAELQSGQEKILTQLREMTREIDRLQRLTTNRVVADISKLNEQDFAARLPELGAALEGHPDNVVPIDPGTMRLVSARLQQAPSDAPGYWPAVVKFLHLASVIAAPGVAPATAPQLAVGNKAALSLGTIRDRMVILDGGELVNTRIENSRVQFTNKAVRLTNVVFVNCLFEFDPEVSGSPIPIKSVRDAGRQLLVAKDISNVAITVAD